MAYVDHAFSITDEDDLVGDAAGGRPRGASVKEISFAAALLAFSALGVVAGLVMAAHRVGGDHCHGRPVRTARQPSSVRFQAPTPTPVSPEIRRSTPHRSGETPTPAFVPTSGCERQVAKAATEEQKKKAAVLHPTLCSCLESLR